MVNPSNSGRAVDNDEIKIKSLEEKSKSSRARVHYKKFTKSKDLTNATKVDLDCILGRHKRKNVEAIKEEEVTTNSQIDIKEEIIPSIESTFITKTNSLSMNDYFAAKMAEIAQRKQVAPQNIEKKMESDSINGTEDKKWIKRIKEETTNIDCESDKKEDLTVEMSQSKQTTMEGDETNGTDPKKKKRKNRI